VRCESDAARITWRVRQKRQLHKSKFARAEGEFDLCTTLSPQRSLSFSHSLARCNNSIFSARAIERFENQVGFHLCASQAAVGAAAAAKVAALPMFPWVRARVRDLICNLW
jgi:hypothetical protein